MPYIKTPEALARAKRLTSMTGKIAQRVLIISEANPSKTHAEVEALKSVVEAFEVIEGLLGDVAKLREKTGWDDGDR